MILERCAFPQTGHIGLSPAALLCARVVGATGLELCRDARHARRYRAYAPRSRRRVAALLLFVRARVSFLPAETPGHRARSDHGRPTRARTFRSYPRSG